MQVIYERCAAVDVGKDVIAVAVRKPGDGPGGRVTVRRTYKTFYGVLREAARWLMAEGVTHVAMEATGIYRMPVYYALLEHGDFGKVMICNAAHVKNVPGRARHRRHHRPGRHCRDRHPHGGLPTAAHLVSWAKWCPQVAQSGGKRKGANASGRGNRYLGAALGEADVSAGRTIQAIDPRSGELQAAAG